jgi:hypothetical protein
LNSNNTSNILNHHQTSTAAVFQQQQYDHHHQQLLIAKLLELDAQHDLPPPNATSILMGGNGSSRGSADVGGKPPLEARSRMAEMLMGWVNGLEPLSELSVADKVGGFKFLMYVVRLRFGFVFEFD